MSNNFYSWRGAVLKSNLPQTTRHVLLTLGCHMNDAGESCYPSIELLCEETGLSKPAVIKHLQIAKEEGWIVVSTHGFGGQRWARNEYQIAWPEVIQNSVKGSKQGLPPYQEISEKAVNLATEGGKPGDKRRLTSHEKVVNDVYSSSSNNNSISNPVKPSVATKSQPAEKITFDAAMNKFAIPMICYAGWESVFPKLDLDTEIDKAELWLTANPARRKKNYERFLLGWFTRAAENAKPKVFVKQSQQPGAR